MGSDDFVSLDASNDTEHQKEENGVHESNSAPSEARHGTSKSLNEVTGDSLAASGVNDEIEDGEHVQDMDLESDPCHPSEGNTITKVSTKMAESAVVFDTSEEIQPEKAHDSFFALTGTDVCVNNFLIDDSPIAGVKRARTCVDQQPCVRVVYNSLTRESKKKLMELMQQWSEWHADCKSSSTVDSAEALENGEETYYPALHVGLKKTSTVSFWVDNQARGEDTKSIQFDNESVPLYDRGYTLGSTSNGGSTDIERVDALEDSRCFNCGSYSHSLKECPKPRNNAAINNARKRFNSKRTPTQGSRVQVRYYQKSQGKFDDLKPGVLGPETRESLGIGESDPPPWFHRMLELGYPPGYLEEVEDKDQPSGITIFADEEEKVDYEDGELPERGSPVPPEKKMTVEFPGINAPIPENADRRSWSVMPSQLQNRSHHQTPTRLSESLRGRYSDQRNDEYGTSSGYRHDPYRGHYHERQRDDYPPGTEPGSGSGFAAHGYSLRHASDHDNSPYMRSPSLGRSLSDRGWKSPGRYDGLLPGHSPRNPYPYPSGSQESPAHPYTSPSPGFDRWGHQSPSTTSETSSAKQDHHHHHSDSHDRRSHHRS